MNVVIDKNRLDEVTEEMCEEYCKWPDELSNQEELDAKCEECPLYNIRYPLGRNDWQE